jgi:type IV pilus assembly protein PilB
MAVVANASRIGELLVRDGLITREQLDKALRTTRRWAPARVLQPGQARLRPRADLALALARQHRVPAVDLERVKLDPKLIKLIPPDLAMKHLVLPLRRVGRTLTVAMSDPGDMGVLDDLKFITRFDIEPVIAGEFTLRKLVEREYDSADERINDLLKQFDEEARSRCSRMRRRSSASARSRRRSRRRRSSS